MSNVENYESIINYSNQNKDQLVIIDFKASWCGPCKMIHPFIMELQEQYPNIRFFEVDVDDSNHEETVSIFNITAMPTFVYMKNGTILSTVCGANKDEIVRNLTKFM
jgi:thioredoxin 1